MSDIVALLGAIGATYENLLEQNSMPPLQQGGVLYGLDHVTDTRTPNSVVIVPTDTNFTTPKATSYPSGVVPQNSDRLRARPIWGEEIDLDVHVWGAANPSNFAGDLRVTQELYSLFLVACFKVATISIMPKRLSWESQKPGATTKLGLGQYVILQLTVFAPLTDLSVNFVPPGTKVVNTVAIAPNPAP